MASRSLSQARSQQAQETKNKAIDVNSGSKPGKPASAANNGSNNGGGACGGGNGGNNGVGNNNNGGNIYGGGGGGAKRRNGGGGSGEPKGNYNNSRRGGNNNGAFTSQQPRYNNNGGGGRNRQRGGGGGGNRSNAAAHSSSHGGGRYPTVTEADEIEIGSVFKSGSKKQNLNHLLNFKKYEPRGNNGAGANAPNRRGPRPNKWQGKGNRHVPVVHYTREQYLAANCQFLVKSSGDYTVQMVDPDVPVDWENIEEVKLFTAGSDPLNCPICLFPPRPGKIGRCGHVFCWPCILHYLALSDDDYRKCPICDDKIHKQDLKSVRVIQQETYSTGSTIELRLMKRERNSLFAVPVTHAGLDVLPTVEDPALDRSLSKFVKATPEQVIQLVLDRERAVLEAVYAEEKDTPEAVFITEAMRYLENKVESCVTESLALATHEALPAMIQDTPPTATAVLEALSPDTEIKYIAGKMKALDPFSDDFADDQPPTGHIVAGEAMTGVDESPVTSPDADSVDAAPPQEGAIGERPRHTSSGSSISSEGENFVDSSITADDLDISCVQSVHKQSADHVQQSAEQGQQSADNNTATNSMLPERPHALAKPKDVYYFYQEVNGQRIFMHALNIQMLVHEHGSLEQCPHTITAKILEMDSSTMNDTLRQRLRYLRHIPLSCSFDVAELDLNAQLSRKTIAHFKDQLAERRKRRQRKMTAEQRREKKIRLEEMRIMNRFPSPVARIESVEHYPSMDESFGVDPVLGQEGTSEPHTDETQANESSASTSSNIPAGPSPGLNFASIAKKAKAPRRVAAGDGKSSQHEQSAQQDQPKYVGISSGMVRLGGALPRARVVVDSDSEPEMEGYVPAPQAATLGASLAQALAQVGSGQSSGAQASGKKKGRRNRGIPVQL